MLGFSQKMCRICCACSGHWGRHVRRHWNLFTNSPKAFPPHVWPSSSDSCIPSERGPCYVGSTPSSSIGVVQMRCPRSKGMAWAGHFQGGVPVAECSIQFNSIYFKTHNIKKQAIQIQIIISHMVRMKYN